MGNQEDVINMLSCTVNNKSFSINGTAGTNTNGDLLHHTIDPWEPNDSTNDISCWTWWRNYYYPHVVTPSYPVYIKEKSYDKGEKAYEIIKTLRDKKIIEIKEVKDFVKVMDELIKLL